MLTQALTLLLIGLFIGVSQSAGIGGGTIINILLIGGLGYNAKQSIIITYIFLMGGGLASTFVSLKKKTIDGKKLIDYDLVMITLPMTMSGAIIGTVINHFLSELFITIIFIILILYVIYTTYIKYQEIKNTNHLSPLLITNKNIQILQTIPISNIQQTGRLQEILQEQNNIFPMDKIKIIVQIYIYTFVILIIRGGRTYDSLIGLQKCSIGSWICMLFHLFLSYLYCKSYAIKKYQLDLQKQSLGYVYDDQNEKMSDTKMRDGMINGLIAGIMGACVSIGGGMVLVPLWLKAGVDRNIATSSTGPLIFLSSSISFLISVLLGKYDSFWLVLLFFIVSVCGSYLVKNLLIYIIEKYRLKTLILLLLLFMMVLSLIVLLPSEYRKYMEDPQEFIEFDDLC